MIKMALKLQPPTLPMPFFHYRNFKLGVLRSDDSRHVNQLKVRDRGTVGPLSALPGTAASVAVAATIVGAAATFLVRKTKSNEISEAVKRICDDCGGSGVCPECNGEGFVLKRKSDESAEKARLMATNAATRYTAGLPKKWSYCTKCSSARSCCTCGGTGVLT